MAFTFTTDAAYPETDGFDVFGGHVGYLIHDYGAGVFAGQPTYAWTGRDPTPLTAAAVWMRSPGAVTLGPTVGFASSAGSQSVTVPLSGAVASGRHLLIMLGMLADLPSLSVPGSGDISVSDSVGGNALQFGGFTDIGFAWSAEYSAGSWPMAGWGDFYRINNALGIGASVTVTLSGFTVYELHARLHVLAGLDAANPIGPNAGGNLVGFGDNEGFAATPHARTAPPVPNWVGPTLILANQWANSPTDFTVALERGGVPAIAPDAFAPPGRKALSQLAMPLIVLTPGSTIEIDAYELDGTARSGDVFDDIRLWVEDE